VRPGLSVEAFLKWKLRFLEWINSELSPMTWKKLVLGKLNAQDAVSNGQVVIAGADPLVFYDFMDLFDE
jgi:hypothetical protein